MFSIRRSRTGRYIKLFGSIFIANPGFTAGENENKVCVTFPLSYEQPTTKLQFRLIVITLIMSTSLSDSYRVPRLRYLLEKPSILPILCSDLESMSKYSLLTSHFNVLL